MNDSPKFVKGDRVRGLGQIAGKTGTVHTCAERLALNDGTVIEWYALDWDETGFCLRVNADVIEPFTVANPPSK